jgi:uncharacterized Ntn-hydrolase superfamily protein
VRRCAAWLVTALGLTLCPTTASATWSIVAVDPQTQEVGVAVASCVPAPYGSTLLPYVAGLAPGQGALAAQAYYSEPHRDQALALLATGTAPQAVIDMVLAGDPEAATRQYGVVTLDLQTAAFTGASTDAWAGHLQSRGVSVQGNILHGPDVATDALAAFEADAPACPWTLADRLMLALEAGAAQGGDNRCSERQSALAAALRVAVPGDGPEAPSLDLRIPSQAEGGDNPVALLRITYDQWRQDNPPDDARCSTGTSSASGDASTSTSMASTSNASHGDQGVHDPSPPASSDGPPTTSTTSEPASATSPASGCRCRATQTPLAAPLGLLLLPFCRRRRRALRS